MSVCHSFSVELAVSVGVEGAILLNHFGYWHQRNQSTGNNLVDGRYWTYSTMKALAEQFPYWNERQLRYTITKLVSDDYLVLAHHGGNDRTTWYALSDKGMMLLGLSEVTYNNVRNDLTKLSNGSEKNGNSNLQNRQMHLTKSSVAFDKNVKSLYKDTDTNTDTSTNTKHTLTADENASDQFQNKQVIKPDFLGQKPPGCDLPPTANLVTSPRTPQEIETRLADWHQKLQLEHGYLQTMQKQLKAADRSTILQVIADFVAEFTAKAHLHTDYADFRRHVWDWARIQLQKSTRNKSHATQNAKSDTNPDGRAITGSDRNAARDPAKRRSF